MTNLVALPPGTELVGDYRVERVLGAGGFGITYLATEKPLARLVTIKEYFPVDFAARERGEDVVPRSQGSVGDYEWGLERFLEEAQTLAKFAHPNIVRVYRYFRARKTGYIVLQFEEGPSLKGWLNELGRAPRQQELDRIVAPLLDALEYIHAADYLHRDIAPDNIIIRTDGTPVLIDFGSARGDIARQTKTLSALVKPGYSPYEQYATTTSTRSMQGPWTDIYSLGATLYHAVTGKRPPDAPSRMVADDMVAVRDAALSSYRPGFLAAIDRALALDMEERPQTVSAWRSELLAPAPKPGRRSLFRTSSSRPAEAGPEPAPQPAPAMAAAAPPAPPAPPGADASIEAGARRPAQAGLLDLFLDAFRDKQRGSAQALGAAPAPAPAAPAPAAIPSPVPPVAAEPAPPPQPEPPAPAPGSRRATPRAIRSRSPWRWRPLLAKLGIGGAVAAVAVAMLDRTPNVQSEGEGTLLNSLSGDVVPLGQLKGHRGPIQAIGFSGDGRFIVSAAADATVRVWHAQTRALVRTIELDNGAPTSMAIEGRRIATGHRDGTVALWDVDSGAKLISFRRNDASIWSVAFLGEPGRVSAAGHDSTVAVWDMRTPTAPAHVLEGHEGAVQAVAFSTRTGHIATGGADRTVRLWKADSEGPIRSFRGLSDFVSAVAFSPDGRRLAAASLDGQIRVWWAIPNGQYFALRGHRGRVAALAFSPDGEMLASASEDGSLRLWSIRQRQSIRTVQPHTGELKAVSFAPDGRRIGVAGSDGLVRLYNAGAQKPGT